MRDRYKILIVDDSSMNRDMLVSILGDKYDYLEASNGMEALRVVEKYGEDINLILLDVVMPVMDGYEFLEIMNKNKLTEKIPVIVISSHSSDEILEKVYELGVFDCFFRPYMPQMVVKKVENALALNERYNRNIDDAVKVLSNVYYIILRANFTDDTYDIVKVDRQRYTRFYEGQDKISRMMYDIATSELIFSEDKNRFIKFNDIDEVRESLKKKKAKLTCQYRRLIDGEYRWVSMEIIKNEDYRDDNQTALVYIKDIHNDYLEHMNNILFMSGNQANTFKLNITKDICEDGTIAEYIDIWTSRVPSVEDVIKIKETFCRDNLLSLYEEGKDSVALRHIILNDNNEKIVVKSSVKMIKNSFSGDIEGVGYFVNILDSYINERIPEIIIDREHVMVALLNIRNETFRVKKCEDTFGEMVDDVSNNYDRVLEIAVEKYISPRDARKFLEKASIDSIIENIEKFGKFDFTVNHIDNGKNRIIKHRYSYLDKELGIVVVTTEDVTSIIERDMITGGINRRGFIRMVRDRLNKDTEKDYAIVYYDVKGFKAVNEILGIDGGDFVLKHIYNMLCGSKFNPVVVSRIETDHFMMLVEKDNIDSDIFNEICNVDYCNDGKKLTIYGRCGIFYIDNKSMQVSGMCDRAKLAGEFIDSEFVKPYAVFDESMRNNYVDRTELMGELVSALDNQQFKVYYQPIYDAKTGQIASAEALIRWIHPERGIISPGLFVPALEDNGHISRVDHFVETNVRGFIEKRRQNDEFVVPVSVNLSWMDFYDENIVNSILSNIKNSEDDKGYRRFEVTETAYTYIADNNNVLKAMKDLGAKILLDDFGSGYSSFSTLRDYDFDIIKLDMGFVQNIDTNPKAGSIIRSIIEMAHNMNAKVIAEGAETNDQVQFLIDCGCDYIQGYYFSKPLPQEEFEKLLNAQSYA